MTQPPTAETPAAALTAHDADELYRRGANDVLNHLLGLITNDREHGVALDAPRILAAIATTRRQILPEPS